MDLLIHDIDPSVTGPFLEVLSDGIGIWYSASPRDDPTVDAATTLYRYDVDTERVEAVWESADPTFAIVRMAGEVGTIAFAELDVTPGDRAWNLWLLPERGAEPILLDKYPGGDDVPGAVPSFDVETGRIVWTAFDRGDNGPVSQMWLATSPDWEPQLLATRQARERELWLPSMWLDQVAFVEVIYDDDRTDDERRVLLMDLSRPDAEPRRLDTSGLATMPLLTADGLVWKEGEEGMSMFNWGWLAHYRFEDRAVHPISMGEDQINYPSLGSRFVAAGSIDSTMLLVYDLDRREVRTVELNPPTDPHDLAHPSLTGNLLVWIVFPYTEEAAYLRWTYLPYPGADVRGFPDP
jgi:hypothetical protein